MQARPLSPQRPPRRRILRYRPFPWHPLCPRYRPRRRRRHRSQRYRPRQSQHPMRRSLLCQSPRSTSHHRRRRPPPVIPVPPSIHESVPEPPAEEEGDFDLVISEAAEEPEPAPAPAPEMSGEPVGCSVCGFPMDPAWKVCPNCVSRYETHCDNCGRTLQAWWLICPWCETPKKPDHIHVG